MSLRSITAALETKLAAFAAAQSPALQVAYTNQRFTRPDTTHLECKILPNENNNPSIGGQHIQKCGIFQVTVLTKTDIGSGTSQRLSDAIEAYFPCGLQLTSGSVNVKVLHTPSTYEATPADGWLRSHVSIKYKVDIFS